MVNRLRLGPEGGPFVTIDEDAGELKIDAPGDVDLRANTIINALFGDTDFAGSELQNAALFGASLANTLDANGQDIDNANQVNATDVNATSIDATGITTTLDLVVNGSVTGLRQGFNDGDNDDVFTLPETTDTIETNDATVIGTLDVIDDGT